MRKSRKTKRSLLTRLTNKPVLLTICLILIAGTGLAYWQLKADGTNETAANNSDAQAGNYVNLEPATEVEKQESEDKKTESSAPPSPPPTTSGKKQVRPEIDFADRSEVRAHVEGIFEEGGTCTATATKAGSEPITAISTGFRNYNNTQCEPIQWSLNGSGWSVVLSYNSSKAEGKSESFNVE